MTDKASIDDLENIQIDMDVRLEEDKQPELATNNVVLEDTKTKTAMSISGIKSSVSNVLAKSAHPTALIFHSIFKLAATICYIFFGIVSSDKVIMYILVISLCAFDFWTVKNVTGRILVGLRWWSTIDEGGKETWHFESVPDRSIINDTDRRMFWGF